MPRRAHRESTHILIASEEDHLDLMAAASSGEPVRWLVPKGARVGDRVIFFYRPVGLLAEAEMSSAPEETRTVGRFGASASSVALLRHPIPLEVLLERFPSWGWPTYPRGYVTVPAEVLPGLEGLIEERR